MTGRVNYNDRPADGWKGQVPFPWEALNIRPASRDATEVSTRLADLDLEAHLSDPALKQRFVTPMFDLIAPRYDRFTRVFSFGMDRRWKAELTAWISTAIAPTARVIDLACGTGDLAFAAARRVPQGEVIGIDTSAAMIDIARRRAASERAEGTVRFVVGDISSLAHEDASVDAIIAGYAVRNVPDYQRVLAEVARVLKPGGVLATLDFYRPQTWAWRVLFLQYLTVAGNALGWAWHREPVAYGYIARSIDHFVSWQRFSSSLEHAGLPVERVRVKLFGGIALHFARRTA
jgi:demethylmenaquinone methyltransferase/2-methoxy-6-polyprenyl-1,4-benzoquinol methylase